MVIRPPFFFTSPAHAAVRDLSLEVPRGSLYGFIGPTLAFLLLAAATSAQESPLAIAERTEHFVIRCRPGSRAEASVDRVASLVEADLARILRELDLDKFPHTIELFLYDDERDLQAITGVPVSGYSVPLASHVPHDNDQTRVHELVHVVAEKFAEREWARLRKAFPDVFGDRAHAAVRRDQQQHRGREGRARIRRYHEVLRKTASLAVYERLFAAWHVLHLPLFYMLILTALIHVVAVHLY